MSVQSINCCLLNPLIPFSLAYGNTQVSKSPRLLFPTCYEFKLKTTRSNWPKSFKIFANRHPNDLITKVNQLALERLENKFFSSPETILCTISAALPYDLVTSELWFEHIVSGDLESMKRMSAYGFDSKRLDFQEQSALHLAARLGKVDILEFLIKEERLDVNAPDILGKTPLYLAISHQQVEAVSCLLLAGASPLFPLLRTEPGADSNLNALHLAVAEGNISIVELLKKRCDEDLAFSQDIRTLSAKETTPLHLAAREGFVSIACYLYQEFGQEADLNKSRIDGLTPLHFAAANGRVKMVEQLLEWGANPYTTDCEEELALDLAIAENRHEVVKLLQPYALPKGFSS